MRGLVHVSDLGILPLPLRCQADHRRGEESGAQRNGGEEDKQYQDHGHAAQNAAAPFPQAAAAERDHAFVNRLAPQLETGRADENQLAQLFGHFQHLVQADTALVAGVTLVTRNTQDFDWIPGLALLDPFAKPPSK